MYRGPSGKRVASVDGCGAPQALAGARRVASRAGRVVSRPCLNQPGAGSPRHVPVLFGLRASSAKAPPLANPDPSERSQPWGGKRAETTRPRKSGIQTKAKHGGVSSSRPEVPLPGSSAPSLPPGPQVPREEGVRLGAHDLRAGLVERPPGLGPQVDGVPEEPKSESEAEEEVDVLICVNVLALVDFRG